jgi:hypothetical protein
LKPYRPRHGSTQYGDFGRPRAAGEGADRTAALLEVGAAAGLRGDTVLDVACGTGDCFIPLLEHDSDTLTTYRGFFTEHVEVEANGRRMIWDGRGTGNGPAEPGEISEALFEGLPHQPMSEDAHTKAIYVARRKRTT